MTPWWYRKIEWVGVVAFYLLWVVEAVQLVSVFKFSTTNLILILAAFLLAAIAADLVSGCVHWFADTCGHANWFLVGPALIRPFREHHDDPMSITRHDFIETNGSLMILGSGLLSAQIFVAESVAAQNFLFVFGSLIAHTNQIHKLAHLEKAPNWYLKLASFGLVLSPRHHRTHHTADHNSAYCITLGFGNRILDRLQFFRGLERLLSIEQST